MPISNWKNYQKCIGIKDKRKFSVFYLYLDCLLSCGNGGTLDPTGCSCTCDVNWGGNNCSGEDTSFIIYFVSVSTKGLIWPQMTFLSVFRVLAIISRMSHMLPTLWYNQFDQIYIQIIEITMIYIMKIPTKLHFSFSRRRGEFGTPLKLHWDEEGRFPTSTHAAFSRRGGFHSGNLYRVIILSRAPWHARCRNHVRGLWVFTKGEFVGCK